VIVEQTEKVTKRQIEKAMYKVQRDIHKERHTLVIVEQTKKDTKRQIEKLCTKYKETYEKKDTPVIAEQTDKDTKRHARTTCVSHSLILLRPSNVTHWKRRRETECV